VEMMSLRRRKNFLAFSMDEDEINSPIVHYVQTANASLVYIVFNKHFY